ncbi:MAG: hypothetical protein ACK4MX_11940, partial [Thermaurantiacus sp.]
TAVRGLGVEPARVEGAGWSTVIAGAVARRLGMVHTETDVPKGDIGDWRANGLPDLTPDWAGTHLLKAWRMLRAETCFEPWFEASAAAAREFDPADLEPERLAVRHLALMRARAAPACLAACLDAAAADG